MFSASPISLTEAYTPSSSMRCHRQARASAFRSAPSGCGFDDGHKLAAVRRHDALAATAALEAHRNPHDERGPIKPGLDTARITLPFSRRRSRPPQACQALGPDPYLECVLLHVDPLDQELHDPRLLGGEQFPQTVRSRRSGPTAAQASRGAKFSREQGACASCCWQDGKDQFLVPAVGILRETGTLYPYDAEALAGGRLHDHPALQVVHHLGA